MAAFKTLDDLPPDLTGKRVLVRVDLNVPMEGASVTDDTRLRAMLPTVLELADRGAIILLLSHFGRPKGQNRPDMSTAQLVRPLTLLSGRSVRFIEDCQGPEAERAIATMLPVRRVAMASPKVRMAAKYPVAFVVIESRHVSSGSAKVRIGEGTFLNVAVMVAAR